MRLVAPFRSNHTAIREVAGVHVTIRREGERSIVDVDHADAIAALRRFGFAPAAVSALFDKVVEANARTFVSGTVAEVVAKVAEVEDRALLDAMLDAEQSGRARTTAIAAIRKRLAGLVR